MTLETVFTETPALPATSRNVTVITKSPAYQKLYDIADDNLVVNVDDNVVGTQNNMTRKACQHFCPQDSCISHYNTAPVTTDLLTNIRLCVHDYTKNQGLRNNLRDEGTP